MYIELQVCKKRKAFSKENNGTTGSKHGNVKLYKHVELIPLSAILRVVDIKETEGKKLNRDFHCVTFFFQIPLN